MKLTMHIDGGSRGNPGPAAAGVVIEDNEGVIWLEAGYFLGRRTNNQAEYGGLIRGLEAAGALGPDALDIVADSELLVRQINGEYRVKSADLRPLYEDAVRRLNAISNWSIRHVRREFNRRADALANAAMSAGRDVVETEAPGGIAKPAVRAKPARAADETSESDDFRERFRPVTATCITAPEPARCAAPCRRGARYQFDQTVAAGVCLQAAPAILSGVAYCQTHDSTEVSCAVVGCGAKFELAATTRKSK